MQSKFVNKKKSIQVSNVTKIDVDFESREFFKDSLIIYVIQIRFHQNRLKLTESSNLTSGYYFSKIVG